MSNYPPGVTGNEPQIRGYDERETYKECGSSNPGIVRAVNQSEIHSLLTVAKSMIDNGNPKIARTYVEYAIEAFNQGFLLQDVECEFAGVVEVIDQGVQYWTCPVCDYDHEDEPDTDDQIRYDRGDYDND